MSLPRTDNNRCDDAMKVVGLPRLQHPNTSVRAVDLARTEVFGAIDGKQQGIGNRAKAL